MTTQVTIQFDTGVEYKTLPFDLRNCLIALQRSLMCLEPKVAEELWWQRGQTLPKGKWIETRQKGTAPHYMFIGDDMGRSSTTRPKVAPEEIIIVELPATTPTVLREYFGRLLEEFDNKYPDDRSWSEPLHRRVMFLHAMYSPDCHQMALSAALEGLRDHLRPQAPDDLDQFLTGVVSSHRDFDMYGRLAAELILIGTILKKALRHPFAVVPGASMESLLNCDNVESFLFNIVRQFENRGETLKLIKSACDEMQTHGESLQERAIQSDTLGHFYGGLFISVPWLLGAHRGFTFLIASNRRTDEVVVAANVCDERIAIANTSVGLHFPNTLDYRCLLSNREYVEKKRTEKGERAAAQIVDQFIDIELLYPSFVRPYLLRQTDDFPNRRPPA
jgi:hypothetical protein